MDTTKEESLEQLIESLRTSFKSIPEVDFYKQTSGWSDPQYGAVPPLTAAQISQLPKMTVSSLDANINGTTHSNISLNGSVLQAGTTSNAIWTTGTGGYTINNPYTVNPMKVDSGGQLSLQGAKADIDINGKSLKTWMERVEERLNILTPNDKLEEEWEELKSLGEQYRRLEQHIRDKQATWDRLKAMPPPVAE
jgi:hypothetical protein